MMKQSLHRTPGIWEVIGVGVALIVASCTLVSDFSGFSLRDIPLPALLALAFSSTFIHAISAVDLSVAYPVADP